MSSLKVMAKIFLGTHVYLGSQKGTASIIYKLCLENALKLRELSD